MPHMVFDFRYIPSFTVPHDGQVVSSIPDFLFQFHMRYDLVGYVDGRMDIVFDGHALAIFLND